MKPVRSAASSMSTLMKRTSASCKTRKLPSKTPTRSRSSPPSPEVKHHGRTKVQKARREVAQNLTGRAGDQTPLADVSSQTHHASHHLGTRPEIPGRLQYPPGERNRGNRDRVPRARWQTFPHQ